MEITCNKCGRTTEINILDDLDYLNPDMVDLTDNTLTFYFTQYCEYPDEEDDECGHEFEIEVPVAQMTPVASFGTPRYMTRFPSP